MINPPDTPDNPISTSTNGWRTISNSNLSAVGTIAKPEPISLPISAPTPPTFAYSPVAASRSPVQTPDLSTVDNLRQYYTPGSALRRFWPRQAQG